MQKQSKKVKKMILITGGAGYIGSHFVKLMVNKGFEVIVFDNLSRGHIEAVPPKVKFIKGDLANPADLENVFIMFPIKAIVHFAAFAYVGESVEDPAMYYNNNVVGTFNLIQVAKNYGIKKFVFSSTCSLYGNPLTVPISEDEPLKPINPYASSKRIIETMLQDFDSAYGMKFMALRYFNAAGCSSDSTIGESHTPEPHLIPLVIKAALGERESIRVFGTDYDTPDGTCIRDYIHVEDLAEAHHKALKYLDEGKNSEIINLGTGKGYSVLEIIDEAEKITGARIKTEMTERRPGDPAILVADSSKALNLLDWKPEKKLNEIIQTAWNWHKDQRY